MTVYFWKQGAMLLPPQPLGLFQKFDTNKTGFLTRQQFAEMMVHLGLSFSSDDDLLVDAEVAMLGDERDRVSFQKWERWYSNLPSGSLIFH